MPVISRCPNCKTKLSIKERLFGKRIRCPKCKRTHMAPAAPAADVHTHSSVQESLRTRDWPALGQAIRYAARPEGEGLRTSIEQGLLSTFANGPAELGTIDPKLIDWIRSGAAWREVAQALAIVLWAHAGQLAQKAAAVFNPTIAEANALMARLTEQPAEARTRLPQLRTTLTDVAEQTKQACALADQAHLLSDDNPKSLLQKQTLLDLHANVEKNAALLRNTCAQMGLEN